MIENASQVIERLGGTVAVAALLSRPYTTVRSWQDRDSIPPAIWSDLVEAARRKSVRGVTYKALVELHKRQRAA
jgi:hypothetical protein